MLLPTEPYRSQQLVILFKDGEVSGATIGYYGTITRVISRSLIENPSRPDRWVYRVLLPYFHSEFDLRADEFYVTGTTDPMAISADSVCEIQFDNEIENDNDEIYGAYRLPTRDWDHFVFRKYNLQRTTYQLNLPISDSGTGISKLCYCVPSKVVLNRDYVLQAIVKIIGLQKQSRN